MSRRVASFAEIAASAKHIISYNPETGEMVWSSNRSRVKAGAAINCISEGYVVVRIMGRLLMAHRVAWLIFYGQWPDGEIDHIDGNRSNNKIVNLRLVDKSGNSQNSKKQANNTSGVTGVGFVKSKGKWRVRVVRDGVTHYFGYFHSFDLAVAKRAEAEKILHPFRNRDLAE